MAGKNGAVARVLVVDDSTMMRDVVGLILQASPMISVLGGVGSGDEALAALDGRAVDVVTVDLELPDMDGRALVTQLRERDQCGVIVLSGSPDRIGNVPWLGDVPVFDKCRLIEDRDRFIAAVLSAAANSPHRRVGAMVEASRAYRRRIAASLARVGSGDSTIARMR